ncbi:MAG: AmmeMemoRadiSam system radical SAM enzyme [Elusimicrobiota bacterium]
MIECQLCPKKCRIPPGKSGDCRVRLNIDGRLISASYGRPCALHVDPIEKKPLFHFMPGSPIFSISTAGCNLHCKNCQNWQISQNSVWDTQNYNMPPEKVVRIAKKEDCKSIAYTYGEPSIFYEYTYDTARIARKKGLKNVMVTSGYLNPGPVKKLYTHIDAANTDLKSINDKFYRDICDATLKPVLDTLVLQKKLGVWVEVTNLVIPTLNDDPGEIRKLAKWIFKNLGEETPLHFSRFYPTYKMRNLPPTPTETLKNARKEARNAGLKYVYIGNVGATEAEDTFCPECGEKIIDRTGYKVNYFRIKDGKCENCSNTIEGVW